jgi:hypothetical protein
VSVHASRRVFAPPAFRVPTTTFSTLRWLARAACGGRTGSYPKV